MPKVFFSKWWSTTISAAKHFKSLLFDFSVFTTWDLFFLCNKLWSFLCIRLIFSFRTNFTFLGSFSKDFNMFRCRLHNIEFYAFLRKTADCSISLIWSSIGINTVAGTVSTEELCPFFLVPSSPLHNLEPASIILKVFCWNFSIVWSWFKTEELCPIIDLTESSAFLILLTFFGMEWNVRRLPSLSYSEIKHSRRVSLVAIRF